MAGLKDKLVNQGSVYTSMDGVTPSILVNASKATANSSKLHYQSATDGYSLDGIPGNVATTAKSQYIRMDSPLKTSTFLDQGYTNPSILDNQPGAYYANGEKLGGRYHNSAPEGRGFLVDDTP